MVLKNTAVSFCVGLCIESWTITEQHDSLRRTKVMQPVCLIATHRVEPENYIKLGLFETRENNSVFQKILVIKPFTYSNVLLRFREQITKKKNEYRRYRVGTKFIMSSNWLWTTNCHFSSQPSTQSWHWITLICA